MKFCYVIMLSAACVPVSVACQPRCRYAAQALSAVNLATAEGVKVHYFVSGSYHCGYSGYLWTAVFNEEQALQLEQLANGWGDCSLFENATVVMTMESGKKQSPQLMLLKQRCPVDALRPNDTFVVFSLEPLICGRVAVSPHNEGLMEQIERTKKSTASRTENVDAKNPDGSNETTERFASPGWSADVPLVHTSEGSLALPQGIIHNLQIDRVFVVRGKEGADEPLAPALPAAASEVMQLVSNVVQRRSE